MEKALDKTSHKDAKTYNLRYEKKFIFNGFYLDDIIQQVVMTNSFGFREVYERRGVNNIYFDDLNYSFYKQNVSGDGLRQKYRLRWYGDVFSKIDKPTFEIKKKFGEVGDKISFKLPDVSFSLDTQSLDEICQELSGILPLKDAIIGSKFKQTIPALFNSYERRYFLSACGRYRITLDYNMHFYHPQFSNFKASEYVLGNHQTIFELKYETQFDDESRELTQQIPVRLSKNSKYVSGIDIIRH